MIKISHLISHCYDRQAGYLSVIKMAYQVRNLDHFLQFRLTRFGLNRFDCSILPDWFDSGIIPSELCGYLHWLGAPVFLVLLRQHWPCLRQELQVCSKF